VEANGLLRTGLFFHRNDSLVKGAHVAMKYDLKVSGILSDIQLQYFYTLFILLVQLHLVTPPSAPRGLSYTTFCKNKCEIK